MSFSLCRITNFLLLLRLLPQLKVLNFILLRNDNDDDDDGVVAVAFANVDDDGGIYGIQKEQKQNE